MFREVQGLHLFLFEFSVIGKVVRHVTLSLHYVLH